MRPVVIAGCALLSVLIVVGLRTLSDRAERVSLRSEVTALQAQLHQAEVAREVALGLVSSCFTPKETAQ